MTAQEAGAAPSRAAARAVDAYARYLATSRFSALDGLRAISVTAVVWHHTLGPRFAGGPLGLGWLGVDFFFAISGFLITTLLLREHRATGRISLRRFYARRALRIFPLYYAVLALYVVLTLATRRHHPEGEAFLGNLPAFLTYTSNWFVEFQADGNVTFYFAWSLATEEQFYLLWPPVLVWALLRLRSTVLAPVLVLAATSAVTLFATYVMDARPLPWTILGSFALPILLGAAGAVLLHDERWFRRLAPVLAATATAPALLAVLLGLCVAWPQHQVIQLTMALVVLACCVRENRLLTPVLTVPPLVWVGTVSYGVYLLHMLASNVMQVVTGTDGFGYFAGTWVLALAAASASWVLFERRVLAFKDRFSAPRTARA